MSIVTIFITLVANSHDPLGSLTTMILLRVLTVSFRLLQLSFLRKSHMTIRAAVPSRVLIATLDWVSIFQIEYRYGSS